MSLEKAIEALTAAVERNNALLSGQASLDVKSEPKKDAKPAADAKKTDKPATTIVDERKAKAAADKKPTAAETAKAADDAYAPVKEATLALHKAKGRPAVEILLSEFGLEKSATELREAGRTDEYDAFILRAKELLEEDGEVA